MAKILSQVVEADINKQSKVIGIVLGALSLPFAFVAGALGGCCPLGSFIGLIPVATVGGLAGFLAAMFLNWGPIDPEESMSVGTTVGFKTAAIASVISAAATFVVSLFSAGGLGAASTAPAGETAGFLAASGVANFLIIVVGIVPGILLGILGGVIGAAIKRPAA